MYLILSHVLRSERKKLGVRSAGIIYKVKIACPRERTSGGRGGEKRWYVVVCVVLFGYVCFRREDKFTI